MSLIQKAKGYINQQDLQPSAQFFALLGNEVRLKIMHLFLEYERLCVCDLADILEMKQSPISQHLRKLKDANLLENKREGMTIFYFIKDTKRAQLKKVLNA
ncbi:winged helix-turn-helix transcriptional regulator [Sulfurimonas sp. MAG313]|nr:winged helix-turn-helix transcriptional regulator [Sulfurimonas sp. MAG313]